MCSKSFQSFTLRECIIKQDHTEANKSSIDKTFNSYIL